jgi:hypothetical protein
LVPESIGGTHTRGVLKQGVEENIVPKWDEVKEAGERSIMGIYITCILH